ncbi:PD40 domain-containing protein [Adhaeribacter aquaticus]|uniref:PD40 domain-containing protein n=1 Tax=Adhaeribacter aquaticus TaxID=299567 RepID=UPI00047E80F8|nr:PD40 domain-containing protein [Adhaeribacter aquaticus]
MLVKRILFIFFLFVCFSVKAQKETSIWYFGIKAGLNFNKTTPAPLYNSQMATNEGCATIADANGNLLFYTNGVYVWNKNHLIMPNGHRLMGHRSSTQSALIVPKPGHQTQYYVFTTDLQSQAYGLRYSLVDMVRNDSTGEVIEKNMFMTSPVTEKLTAIKHQNDQDVWVLVHKWNSDAFVAFLVTDKGVSRTPVTTNIGTTHRGKGKGAIGCMKASPDGKKVALAIWRDINQFEVFDFDNSTGKLSNRVTLGPYPEAYGVEFSPDGSKLYGTTNGIGSTEPQIWQFNLNAGSKTAIASSAILISNSKTHKIGALQLAPDGKIYLAKEDDSYLGVIHNPNAAGWSCRYIDKGLSLGDRKAKLGLPNFVQSYFQAKPLN